MKNELSSIFENVAMNYVVPACQFLFAHKERYTKADGSKYHSKPLKSFFEKAAFKGFATTTGVIIGADLLVDGKFNTDPYTLSLAIAFGAFSISSTLSNDKNMTQKNLFNNNAIDREGRSLSRKQLSIVDFIYLDISKNSNLISAALQTTFGVSISAILKEPAMLMISAPYIISDLDYAHRFHKLIKGHTGEKGGYVICDEPPAKTVKAKSSLLSLGGLTNPAP